MLQKLAKCLWCSLKQIWTMQQKGNTLLPQGAVPTCLVYWPFCFQTAANEKQQKPIDRKKRGVTMEVIDEQGMQRKRGKRSTTSATREVGDRGRIGLGCKEKLRHGVRSQHKDWMHFYLLYICYLNMLKVRQNKHSICHSKQISCH